MSNILSGEVLALSEDERATVDYYEHTDWKRPAGYWNPWINKYMSHLAAGTTVVEIGCGEAYPADLLRASNFQYVGTDITAHFVELAKKRDDSLEVYNMSADELEFAAESFGGWLALNVLQHIERDHLPRVLTEAHRVLEPGGVAFCTVAHHPEDDDDCDRRMWDKRSLGMPSKRLFVFWQRDEVEPILDEAGFSIIDYDTCVTNTAGVNGDSVYWHEYTLRAEK